MKPARLTTIADIFFGLVSLLASGLICLVGTAIFGFGAYGLIAGVHGGPVTVTVMVFFGSALLFIGYHGGLYGFRLIRHRNRIDTSAF